jgi:hypothetical protein
MGALKGLHNGLPRELIQGSVGVDRRGEPGAVPHGEGAKQSLQALPRRRVVVHDRDNWVGLPRLTHVIRLLGTSAG